MASYGWQSGEACSFTTSLFIKKKLVVKEEKVFQTQDHCERKSHEDAQAFHSKLMEEISEEIKYLEIKTTFPP